MAWHFRKKQAGKRYQRMTNRMTAVDDPYDRDAERERETAAARARLDEELRKALVAVGAAVSARRELIHLYDVEHAEASPDDLGHYLKEAARALRAAGALNPTRPGA